MFKNHLKVAFRNLARHKMHTGLNLLGLAIGLACCFLIFAYILHELSYDNYHPDADKIYRITTEIPMFHTFSGGSSYKLTPELRNNFPEILKVARIKSLEPVIKKGNTFFYEDQFLLADHEIFDIFTIPLFQGDPHTVLDKQNAVIITPRIANKYFGSQNPIGEILYLRGIGELIELEVTGIMEEFPINSHIQTDFLGSLAILDIINKDVDRSEGILSYEMWSDWDTFTYIVVKDDCNIIDLEKKILDIWESHLDRLRGNVRVQIQPLKKIRLFSQQITSDFAEHGNLTNIILFASSAVLIVLIAGLNFIILSTARSTTRLKELGIHKIVGAQRIHLINQVLIESLLLTFLALPIAVGLVGLVLSFFNQLLQIDLSINYIMNWRYIFGLICITSFIGIACGGYIALYLTRFHPLDAMGTKINSRSSKSFLRKGLIITQLMIFITLIICTSFMIRQLQYAQKSATLGYDKENLVSIKINDREFVPKYNQFKNEIRNHMNIINVTCVVLPFPIKRFLENYFIGEGNLGEGNLLFLIVGYDYIETLGIQLLEGKTFDRTPRSRYDQVIMLNESAVKVLGLEEPVGKTFQEGRYYQYTVVGVVEDFHFSSLYENVPPVQLYLSEQSMSQVIVRIKPQDIAQTLAFLENTWKTYSSDFFNFTFIDDDLANIYRSENVLEKMIGYAAILAIFVACLGLFGLSLFMAEQRTKELGIRKVLGASTASLVSLLSKEYVWLVLIANLIAWPIAYYAMNKWLQNFAYHINPSWWIFVLSGVLALVIALLTVSYHVIRAATANPVESLRYE